MILISHIIIAILTVGFTGFTFLRPTSRKLKTSYALTLGTFTTGSYLVVSNPAHLVSACIAGITFLGVVFGLLYLAHKKMTVSPGSK